MLPVSHPPPLGKSLAQPWSVPIPKNMLASIKKLVKFGKIAFKQSEKELNKLSFGKTEFFKCKVFKSPIFDKPSTYILIHRTVQVQ
jgi:hypothetical protein